MEIIKKELRKSNKLVNNVSETAWEKLKELAKFNGVTLGKMIEILIDNCQD